MGNFTLSEEEQVLAERFKKRHKNCSLDTLYEKTVPFWKRFLNMVFGKGFCGPFPSHFDYGFSYRYTPTGIGTGITIRCNYCGEEEDITDYSTW